MPNFSELTGQLGQKWQQLDPILKGSILAAGAGGVTGGVLGAMSPKPASPEGRKARRKRIISNAGLAAILAGGATAGIGYGARNLGEVMPKGSLPPGEAAKKLVEGPWGRSALFGAGAAAGGIRESGRAKGIANLLAQQLWAGRGHEGVVPAGSSRALLGAFDRPTHPENFMDVAGRSLGQQRGLDAIASKSTLGKSQIIEQLTRSGQNIDPSLLQQGKLKKLLETKGIGGVAGKGLSFLRRRGPLKMIGSGAGLALAPEAVKGIGWILGGLGGGSGEGEL